MGELDLDDLLSALRSNDTELLQYELVYLDMLRARQSLVSGRVLDAQENYQRLLLVLSQECLQHESLARYVRCSILCQLSSSYMDSSRLDLCQPVLQEARAISQEHGMIHLLQVCWLEGTTKWHMGDFRGALAVHQSVEPRALARTAGRWGWLIASHCAAAKNALELGMFDLASDELRNSSRAQSRATTPARAEKAFHRLCWGELQFHLGNFDEAATHFEDAHEELTAMHHRWGALNTLVTVAECHTLARGNPPSPQSLEKLFAESSNAGFHDLRARILRLLVYSMLAGSGHEEDLEKVRSFVDPRMGTTPAVFLDSLVALHGALAKTGKPDRELLRMARKLEPCVDREYFLATMDAVSE